MVRKFLSICQEINFPVSMDKTELANTEMVFLGILLSGSTLTLGVPLDKRNRALNMLQYLGSKRKAKVGELERLAGFLNFLNKAIVPGRIFTRRMYSKFSGLVHTGIPDLDRQPRKLKQHHHVKLDQEFKVDCTVWIQFLQNPSAVARPFADLSLTIDAYTTLNFYSDASRNPLLGIWVYF